MDPRDTENTSFITRNRTYCFQAMPFGLCNAPATFQHLMNVFLSGLNQDVLLVYLDDIIIHSGDLPSHPKSIERFLERMRLANLKLKVSKCRMPQREVHILGHVVSDNGLKMDPAKIEGVATWPDSQNLKEVRSFVGLCAWYREFVPDFATLTAPLHSLTRKGQRFLWSTECNRSFLELRDRLFSAPVLALPIDDGRFILDVDASDLSVVADLSQRQGGKERVIAYFSKRHAATEMNYCTTHKELLAVVKALRKFRVYLLGRCSSCALTTALFVGSV